MRFEALSVEGAFSIASDIATDDRGSFFRTFCAREFGAHGLPIRFVQHSLSRNVRAGTLRGLHYQKPPHAEAKVVRCLKGSAFDVVVDLRVGTAGYGTWCGVELSAESRTAVFVPRGCAHGFQTLVDETEILYLIDTEYVAESAAGLRWNDAQLSIPWPIASPIISIRDSAFPDLDIDRRLQDTVGSTSVI